MNILQINAKDVGGGAEKIARELFDTYRQKGHRSWLAVGEKRSEDLDIFKIPRLPPSPYWVGKRALELRSYLETHNDNGKDFARLKSWLYILAGPWAALERFMGREDFNFPGSHRILELPPHPPDLVHLHNLHGGYFDLRFLFQLSQTVPVAITLHDEWMLTGHCAYTFECPRWQYGCGDCPDLSIYPAIKRDATAWNWQRKRGIYEQSNLYISIPSRWLKKKADRSILASCQRRKIHHGIDLEIFHPYSRKVARRQLGLPLDGNILLFIAHKAQASQFKDYKTINKTLEILNRYELGLTHFIALGSNEKKHEKVGEISIQHVGYITSQEKIAQYYQAADVFLHAAKAETWGLTVTEALACGTPVIATAVGGISEQIENGETGYLVPKGDSSGMAKYIVKLIKNDQLRDHMGVQAAEMVNRRFGLERMVDDHLEWYEEILIDWHRTLKI